VAAPMSLLAPVCYVDGLYTEIDLKQVRKLATLPVNQILDNSPAEKVSIENYWRKINGRDKPLSVFSYSNNDIDSQRLATLIKYVTLHYQDKLSFMRVQIAEKGNPDKNTAKDLLSRFSLDKTPGILFYDNVGGNMVLEDEEYIDADHKEYRSPKMFFWNTYYKGVRKELDELLAD
jgi:hypothetical protein